MAKGKHGLFLLLEAVTGTQRETGSLAGKVSVKA
jgi:hypothetical protein